jgi:hypothetical protein
MFARLLLAFLLTAAVVVPSAAQGNGQGASGKPGAGEAPSPGSAGGDQEGSSGKGSAQGNPNRSTNDGQQSTHNPNRGGANAPGNNGAGDGKNHGIGGKSYGGDNRLSGATSLSPDEALALVKTHRALPLSELAEIVRQRTGAEMVDVELLRVGQFLVYAIKVIDEVERLSVQYYYAGSGLYIGSE